MSLINAVPETVLTTKVDALLNWTRKSSVWYMGTLLGAAGLYAFLGADFVAVVQLLIYVGGILVLTLFAIMPVYTGWTALAFFAAMGLPGLSAFISEVLVLLGGWRNYPIATLIAASAVVLTAGYMLWAMQRIYLGKPNEKYLTLPDISPRELFTLVPLGAIVIFLGVYPRPILDLQSPALVRLNNRVLAAAPSPAPDLIAATEKP